MKSIYIIILLVSISIFFNPLQAHSISAVFAFGDSTLDSGNNNFLPTLIRADHPPYGCDFDTSRTPTGRFSNGKLITDFLVSALNLKPSLPASSDPRLSADDTVTGVSFASAGSGLDDLTAMSSRVVTIEGQIGNFERFVQGLKGSVGDEEGDRVIKEGLFVIGAGTNDMMMNYYMTPVRNMTYNLVEYHGFLLQRLENLVQRLYALGARKFTMAGLPPIGCLPFQMTLSAMTPGSTQGLFAPRTCIDKQNNDAMGYNRRLHHRTIRKLQSSLPGCKFAYVDIYSPLMDMIRNPKKYGFQETTRGCCGTGTFEMGPLCSIPFPTCSDPSKYLFWDSVHPSQATYKVLADQFMKTVLPQITN